MHISLHCVCDSECCVEKSGRAPSKYTISLAYRCFEWRKNYSQLLYLVLHDGQRLQGLLREKVLLGEDVAGVLALEAHLLPALKKMELFSQRSVPRW